MKPAEDPGIFRLVILLWGYTHLYQSSQTSVYPSWDFDTSPNAFSHLHEQQSQRPYIPDQDEIPDHSALRSPSKGIEAEP